MNWLNGNKEEEFGYDCFSDLREKFDSSLKAVEDKNKQLEDQLIEKDFFIEEIQTELKAKNDEITNWEQKYQLILEKQQDENKKRMDDLKDQISTHSKEIVNGYK